MCLSEGHPREALDRLARFHDHAPWTENARAVCMMRLGRHDEAIGIYRRLLLSGGVNIREDASDQLRVNFASALLLAGNIEGGLDALAGVRDRRAPGAVRLREALARWRKSLGLGTRVLAALGAPPQEPLKLDFPPGEL